MIGLARLHSYQNGFLAIEVPKEQAEEQRGSVGWGGR